MNRRQLTSLVLASGLTLLGAPAFAQSSAGSSSPGTGSASSNINVPPATSSQGTTATVPGASSVTRDPAGVRPLNPSTTPTSPSSSTLATPNTTTATGLESSSSTGASMPTRTPGTLNTTTSRNSVQGGVQLNALDTDSDGRISLSEFTASSTSVGSRNATSMDARNNVGVRQNPTRNATGVDSSTNVGSSTLPGLGSSSGTIGGTTTNSATSSGSLNTAEQFRQLDQNQDGYLSQAELSAAGRIHMRQ